MAIEQQVRRELAARWAVENPILGRGIPGYEIDTKRMKYGDGVTAWNDLTYYTIGIALAHNQLLDLENDDHGQYLTVERHADSHGNKPVLDELTESGGLLAYKGLTIGSEMAQFYADQAAETAAEVWADLQDVTDLYLNVTNAVQQIELYSIATSGDRLQTGLDAESASISSAAASSYMETAIAQAGAASISADNALSSAASGATFSQEASGFASQANISSLNASAYSISASASLTQTQAIAAALTTVTASASRTLSNTEVVSTMIDNLGQVVAADITLPTAGIGMNFVAIISTACSGAWRIRSGPNDKLYTNGVAGLDNGYLGISTPTVGAYISVFSFRTAAGVYDWMAVVGNGNWVIS